MIAAILSALLRKEVLSPDDVVAAAADLDRQGGEANHEAAHLLRCVIVEAEAPSDSDWAADRARSAFRIVPNED